MATGVTETFKLVVALDIGTTYSGYAYSYVSEYKINPLKVNVPQCWNSRNRSLVTHKTPTSLLLDNNEKFLAFGLDAEAEFAEADEPENLFFFHRFKMNLYHEAISKSMVIPDITKTKRISALRVFALAIRALKDDFYQRLREKGLMKSALTERILWVITVPAIWPPSAKLFMIESAKEAGLPEKRITIALEPEAGAICCQFQENLDLSAPGSKYLVADLGGGTADLTVHEKTRGGFLKELHKADGIGIGGTDVDKGIWKLFSEIIGVPNLQSKICETSQFDLDQVIERLKQRVRIDNGEYVICDFPDLILKGTNGENLRNRLQECIQEYAKKYGENKVKMRHKSSPSKVSIRTTLLHEIFRETTCQITERIQKVLDETPSSQTVNKILLVGGFAESSFVVSEVREAFKEKQVVVPTNPGLAVLQGAVIYGHYKEIIKSRILTHSYGKSVCREYDELEDEGRLPITIDGIRYCNNVFHEIVPANKEIERGHEVFEVNKTLIDFQRFTELDFYACPNKTPDYVDDPDCQKIGTLEVPLIPPMSAGRPIVIKIKFGGTVMEVTAMDGINQIPFTAVLRLKED